MSRVVCIVEKDGKLVSGRFVSWMKMALKKLIEGVGCIELFL